MRLSGASRIFVAVACSLFLAGSMKISRLAAQDEPATRQESVESLQITANDEIAAEDVAGHHVHLHPVRSRDASRGRYEDKEVLRGNPRQEFANGESSPANSALSTVPGVPAPGFYPADLSNPAHGRVLTTTQSDNVYVNCAASCWGTPSNFLTKLATSNFIHVTDQYVGSTGNNRYTVGTATSRDGSFFTRTNVAQNYCTAGVAPTIRNLYQDVPAGYSTSRICALRSSPGARLNGTVPLFTSNAALSGPT